jgi:carbamoylphosphate synthase small subunit
MPPSDWRIGATFYVSAALQLVALLMARRHFAARAHRRRNMSASMHCKILILDFGAQYTQLIARRVRELNTYCEIHPHDVRPSFIAEFAPAGIVLSGGPEA